MPSATESDGVTRDLSSLTINDNKPDTLNATSTLKSYTVALAKVNYFENEDDENVIRIGTHFKATNNKIYHACLRTYFSVIIPCKVRFVLDLCRKVMQLHGLKPIYEVSGYTGDDAIDLLGELRVRELDSNNLGSGSYSQIRLKHPATTVEFINVYCDPSVMIHSTHWTVTPFVDLVVLHCEKNGLLADNKMSDVQTEKNNGEQEEGMQ